MYSLTTMLRYNLHPARGRKQSGCVIQVGKYVIQSTPRKGTETAAALAAILMLMIQSTPRKGTETLRSLHLLRSGIDTIYTPQGDGNSSQARNMGKVRVIQSTPRKGTETPEIQPEERNQTWIQSTPRKGTNHRFSCSKCCRKNFSKN